MPEAMAETPPAVTIEPQDTIAGKTRTLYPYEEIMVRIKDSSSLDDPAVKDALVTLYLINQVHLDKVYDPIKKTCKDIKIGTVRAMVERLVKEKEEKSLKSRVKAKGDRGDRLLKYHTLNGVTVDALGRRVIDGWISIEKIARDYRTDDVVYHLVGEDQTGRSIKLRIPAERFFDNKELRVDVESRFDIDSRTHLARVDKLCNIIRDTTEQDKLTELCEVDQVIWINDQLIVPSLEPKGYQCRLNTMKFPYNMPANLDLKTGMDALDHILHAWPVKNTFPVITQIFGSPVVGRILPNFRSGLAVIGAKDAGKTLLTRLGLSIYGIGFMDPNSMIKLVDGSTANAARKLFGYSGVMPCLMDNYKPYKLFTKADLAKLIHSTLEGGDKDRLDKESDLRDSMKFYTSPIITGEDFAMDPATSARVMPLPELTKFNDDELDKATLEMREHLPAIGREWLLWIQSPSGLRAMNAFKANFPATRHEMVLVMKKVNSTNPERLGSNMAISSLSYDMLCSHSAIGWYFTEHKDEFTTNMEKVREQVSATVCEGNEAEELVDQLRTAILRGYFKIPYDGNGKSSKKYVTSIHTLMPEYGKVMGGWYDDHYVYLYPDEVVAFAAKNLGDGAQKLSRRALTHQLASRNLIIKDSKTGNSTVPVWSQTLKTTVRMYKFEIDTLLTPETSREGSVINM